MSPQVYTKSHTDGREMSVFCHCFSHVFAGDNYCHTSARSRPPEPARRRRCRCSDTGNPDAPRVIVAHREERFHYTTFRPLTEAQVREIDPARRWQTEVSAVHSSRSVEAELRRCLMPALIQALAKELPFRYPRHSQEWYPTPVSGRQPGQ